jgi:protein tyrosine/serine phosphatase
VGCTSSELPHAAQNVHVVESGVLIRGAQPDREGFEALKKTYGVATVVNLNDLTAQREADVLAGLGLSYVALPSNAFRPDRMAILSFLQTVQAAQRASKGGAVYVHCQQGMDRTGVAVAAYRILCNGWDDQRALKELRSYQVFPHAQVFWRIEPFVREIYQKREELTRQLAAMSPPKGDSFADAH